MFFCYETQYFCQFICCVTGLELEVVFQQGCLQMLKRMERKNDTHSTLNSDNTISYNHAMSYKNDMGSISNTQE